MKLPMSCSLVSPGLPGSSEKASMTTTPKFHTRSMTETMESPTTHSGGSWGNTTRCGSTFSIMNLFKAALTPELRSIVAQQEQETITIKKMYQVATTAQWELKGKGPALVNKVREEEIPAEGDNDYVAAFNWRGARPKNNQYGGQTWGNYNSGRGGYQTGSGQGGNSCNGSNSNRNGKYCYFCKILGHRQEECRKRIKACGDAQGRYYWPKVYFMEENKAKAVNAINHEEVRPFQGDSPFNIAGLATRTGTTALTPQFPGFQ